MRSVSKSGTLAGTLLQASNHFEIGSPPDNRTQTPAWMIIVIKILGSLFFKIAEDFGLR